MREEQFTHQVLDKDKPRYQIEWLVLFDSYASPVPATPVDESITR